jgi:hypothetical protein
VSPGHRAAQPIPIPISPLKLAMLAPIAWRTPPEHYGPWESIASLLTEGLVARGVDVTLFATLDSVTTAALDGVCPHGYATDARLGVCARGHCETPAILTPAKRAIAAGSNRQA